MPLDVLPAMMLSMAVLILFVYDKNNGVLEYLFSLGMTQVPQGMGLRREVYIVLHARVSPG